MQVGGIVINMARPAVLSPEELKAAPDVPAMAAALADAGLRDTGELAAALADELAEHARHVELADRERAELEAAGQPVYELPMITEGDRPGRACTGWPPSCATRGRRDREPAA